MSQDTPTRPVLPDLLAFALDGRGGAQALDHGAQVDMPPGGFVWTHVRRDAAQTQRVFEAAGLDELVITGLTAEDTRPRCTVHGDGVLLTLRGVNLNPGAAPEDMVSVRLWVGAGQIVGVWLRPLMAVVDLVGAIERGQAPLSPGDFVAKLALRLADKAEPAIAALGDAVDEMEEQSLDPQANVPRHTLASIRRKAIMLRRYLVPQRDALSTLEIEDLDWLQDRDRARLREATERVFRLGEELDAIRDRCQILHDQLADRRAEVMNKQMLVLSVVAAVFLPLGLLTGLLGMNVGGIPGVDSPWAFWITCGLLAVIGVVLFVLFRRIGFLR